MTNQDYCLLANPKKLKKKNNKIESCKKKVSLFLKEFAIILSFKTFCYLKKWLYSMKIYAYSFKVKNLPNNKKTF